MSEQATLEEVLSGEPVVEPEAQEETPETPEPEEVAVVEEVEPEAEVDAVEEPTGVEETEPPLVEKTKEVPLAAMLDERDKRKDLQAQLDTLKASQAKEQEEKVDFWENPEAAINSVKESLRGEFNQQLVAGKLELSMQIAKTYHEDYDVGLEAFKQAATDNPSLVDQALQSEHPGEYIYNTGKQFADLDAVGGDLNAMRETIRNEERAKLMKEMEGKEATRQSVPTALTDETSAGSPRDKIAGGDTSLESIFTHNSG